MAKRGSTGEVVAQRASALQRTQHEQQTPPARKRRWIIAHPAIVFWLMLGINSVNYLDRLLAAAVGPTIQREFGLSQGAIGLLSSAFIIVYTLSALPLGLLADRFARARVVSLGVGLWSVASTATGFVTGFFGLFATRAAVGIGEASYYPAGTALLGGYFPLKERARVMSRWSSGQIIGTALAFVLIGAFTAIFGEAIGWRAAFIVTGPIGLLLAIAMWFVAEKPASAATNATAADASDIKEGGAKAASATKAKQSAGQTAKSRSRSQAQSPAATAADHPEQRSIWQRLRYVARIRSVWIVVVLQAVSFIVITPSITFLPIYVREPSGPFHLSASIAPVVEGVPIVLGGMGGALLGGYLADWLSKRIPGGRVLAASVGSALAIPSYALMLLTHSLPVFVIAATIAILAIFLPVGPVAAVLQDAVPPALRATAIALALLLSHVFGDFWSPSAVGALATTLNNNTSHALLIVVLPALALAVVTGLVAARIYVTEAKYEAADALPLH